MASASDLINTLAKKFNCKRYCEIGVYKGETFLTVDMPFKTGVDPAFKFNILENISPLVKYFKMTSDRFFDEFPEH